jgi:hypothetical protein
MPRAVIDAIVQHIEREAAFRGYESSDDAAAEVQDAYESVARLIDAQSRNFPSSRTSRWLVPGACGARFSARRRHRDDAQRLRFQSACLPVTGKPRGVEVHRASDLRSGWRRSAVEARTVAQAENAIAGGT